MIKFKKDSINDNSDKLKFITEIKDLKSQIEKLKQKPAPKQRQLKEVQTSQEPDTELFSDKPSEILGLQKRQLLKKIQQYKLLFPIELKGFKIKKRPTEDDLKQAIDEIAAILDTSSVETFVNDALYESIGVAEGISKVYLKKFDITGLSKSLKENPQFNSLLKQLYLKYGCFTQIPPETQVVFIIALTTIACIQQNRNINQNQVNQVNDLLNQPTNI